MCKVSGFLLHPQGCSELLVTLSGGAKGSTFLHIVLEGMAWAGQVPAAIRVLHRVGSLLLYH